MGIQTMATHDGGNGSGRSQIQSLARQASSFYNLTLDEVQNHLGEPLHSMNLDELLKSVFPSEVNPSLVMNSEGTASNYASSSGLQWHGSITMPQTLSKKTVDEVWRDIQSGQQNPNNGEHRGASRERQTTFGEMTLEAFLEKAGVVTEGFENTNHESRNGGQGGGSWVPQYHQVSGIIPQHQAQASLNVLNTYSTYPDSQISISSPSLGTLSDPQTPGRKHGSPDDIVDKFVERRQKRMIKNRESAARSRARKQAYTNELENKVSRLEEENDRLKRRRELDEKLRPPPPEPKYQLRRTSSAAF